VSEPVAGLRGGLGAVSAKATSSDIDARDPVDDNQRSLDKPANRALSVTRQVIGTDIVLHVTGEIDLASRELFESHLPNALAVGQRLVLDLQGVEFMDSTGLNAILRCRRRAEAAKAALLIRSPSASVQRLLLLAGVAPLLTIDEHAPNAPDDATGR
jgi:anti-anti-sigma factor